MKDFIYHTPTKVFFGKDKHKEIGKIIKDYGYGDKFIHSTGHSLGLDIHESPGFAPKDDTIIEKGMVITVEPGIYLEGEFGVRLEDTVSISKKADIIGNLPLSID